MYFFRQLLIYLMFVLLYANGLHIHVSYDIHSRKLGYRYCQIVKIWMGLYLLNIERIRIKYNGWKRYFGFYNFFDLLSVIFPLSTSILHGILFFVIKERGPLFHDILIACESFAVLITSIEILLVGFYMIITILNIYIYEHNNTNLY
jgi:hypothetical protein